MAALSHTREILEKFSRNDKNSSCTETEIGLSGDLNRSKQDTKNVSAEHSSRPKCPEYEKIGCRVRSFHNSGVVHSHEEMSRAGFYYTGNGNSVRCFHCGIGLRNWDPQDDPWIEHARFSPNCEHVLQIKGEQFILMVQDAVERQKSTQHTTDNHAQQQQQQQQPKKQELQTKTQHQQRERQQQAQQQRTSDCHDSADLEPDCGHITAIPSRQQNTYPDATLKKNPLLTDAAQVILEYGYLPKTIKIAIDRVLSKHDWSYLNSQNILDEIFQMEANGELDDDKVKVQHSKLPVPTDHKHIKKVDILKIQEENEQYKERITCKICCEDPVGIVFLPCGHVVCCPQCSPAMSKCPLCRKKIKGTVRVSLS